MIQFVVLKVGRSSETEVNKKKDRLNGAWITSAAVEEEIVPGGGEGCTGRGDQITDVGQFQTSSIRRCETTLKQTTVNSHNSYLMKNKFFSSANIFPGSGTLCRYIHSPSHKHTLSLSLSFGINVQKIQFIE